MNISDIIILLFPILLAIALHIASWTSQRLPANQRAELDYYANKAVKFVEMTCTGTSTQKKNAAITMIYAFFKAIKRPVPDQIFIDTAIEEVVWLMNQSKIPDEFVKTSVNTGPIKPVQPGGQPA